VDSGLLEAATKNDGQDFVSVANFSNREKKADDKND
jgi:hypothetical protein